MTWTKTKASSRAKLCSWILSSEYEGERQSKRKDEYQPDHRCQFLLPNAPYTNVHELVCFNSAELHLKRMIFQFHFYADRKYTNHIFEMNMFILRANSLAFVYSPKIVLHFQKLTIIIWCLSVRSSHIICEKYSTRLKGNR